MPNPDWLDHVGVGAGGLPGPVTGGAHTLEPDRKIGGPRRCAEFALQESAPLESLPDCAPVGHRLVVLLEIIEGRIVVVQIDDLPASVGIRTNPTRP
jgi:hypothetical protein